MMPEPNKMKRNHTFMTGMYMAINAIRDGYLIMDGPDCAYKKVELFEKNHDFFTKLFRRDGKHRISATVTDVNHVIDERHDKIVESILKVASTDEAAAVFISSEPMVALTGVDYNMLAYEAQKKTDKKVIPIPYQSLDDDWLDAYAYVLERIATDLDIQQGKTEKDKVAVIGNLFDRNEGDNIGNVEEISRMLKALSLDPCSIWLSGSTFSELERVEEAEYLIKMPYAGKTADIIAEKTGATVIDVGIPFGIEGTRNWLMSVADATGKRSEAKSFLDKEMKRVMPIMEWLVPTYIQGRKMAFAGDPYFAGSFVDAMRDLDADVPCLVLYSRKGRVTENDTRIFCEDDDMDSKTDLLGDVSLVVGCYNSREVLRSPKSTQFMEFGFPSHTYHVFSVEPYMGLRGFMLFLNRMINTYLAPGYILA